MRVKAYSKINLTLRVLNKLTNGMHNIETNSTLVNVFDEINIKKSKKDIVTFKGKFKNNINLRKNSVLGTLTILRKYHNLRGHYKIDIKKNIPVYAGLGGGTSNSVSIVKYFLKNKLNKKLISIFEKKVGSDFKLFLHKSSFQKNLRSVKKSRNSINYFFLIIFPNIHCKTKNIYKMVKNFSSSSKNYYSKRLNKKKFFEAIKKDHNDLQKIVEKKYPKISKLLKFIKKQKGCAFSRMTGSGSACYGVFQSKKTAKLAVTFLKRKYPKYWCAITKTI